MKPRSPDIAFWRGRRVLLTGHTGFKGAWLSLWLHRLGARVTGISLAPNTTPNLFSLAKLDQAVSSHFCDLREVEAFRKAVVRSEPEVVFHLAAQPLVRESYARPVDTFAVNVMGTVHLLDAMRGLTSVRAAVIVTTDKVYRNLERPYPYREDDALGGHDPYSASKAAAELAAASYREAFLRDQGVALATARAGNVIGGGDWSPDRLIPDAVRAWTSGFPLRIRRPEAVRPWQHVLEPLAGYLALAEELWRSPALEGAWNIGPIPHEAASVRSVVELARAAWGPGEVVYGEGNDGPHEAGLLSLETAKIRSAIGWVPRWSLPESLTRTMRWYREQLGGTDARALCETDFEAYGA